MNHIPEDNIKALKIKNCLYEGWGILKHYPIEIFIGIIFYLAGSIFTAGILSGSLGAGLIDYILKLKHKNGSPTPSPTYVFSKLNYVVPTFKVCLLILTLVIFNRFIIGGIFGGLSIFTGFVLYSFNISLITISIPLIGDGRTSDAKEAILTAWDTFLRSPTTFFLIAALIIILNILGAIPFGLGLIVTSPLSACILALASEKLINENIKEASLIVEPLKIINSD